MYINNSDIVHTDYPGESGEVFGKVGSLFSMMFVIAFSSGLSYMIRHYIVEKLYQSLYDWCAETDAGERIDSVTNESIALHVAKHK